MNCTGNNSESPKLSLMGEKQRGTSKGIVEVETEYVLRTSPAAFVHCDVVSVVSVMSVMSMVSVVSNNVCTEFWKRAFDCRFNF